MKMNLIEMEGFLRGKCLPGDIKTGESNAEYLVRKFSELQEQLSESQREFRSADITMQNLEAKCEKLAAENAGMAAELSAIDAIHNDAVFITDDHYEQCPPEVQKIIGALAVLQIPAYQAFLAEVRASGVDAAIEHLNKKFESTGHIGVPVMALEWLAQELRKGVQS